MSGALFGSAGKMIEFFQWEEKQSVKTRRSLSVHDTIGGGSFAFRGKRTRRTWSLSNDELSPEEYRDLELMLYDVQGAGPFWLLDQEARVTNALPPEHSLVGLNGEAPRIFGDATPAGRIRTPEGFEAPSLVSSGANIRHRFDIPVVPGVPITGSVYLTQGASCVLRYVDANGEYISPGGAMISSGSAGVSRFRKTSTPPEGVSAVYFEISGTTLVAAPSVTFTDTLQPWAVGKGCDKAVVSSWDRSFDRMSSGDADRRLVGVSLEVEEVRTRA